MSKISRRGRKRKKSGEQKLVANGKRKKMRKERHGGKVTGGARCVAAVKKRKNKARDLDGEKMKKETYHGVRCRRVAARRCARARR